jgi:hypothetical protein
VILAMTLAGLIVFQAWEPGRGRHSRPKDGVREGLPARGWCSIGQLKLGFQRLAALYLTGARVSDRRATRR